MMKRVSVNVCLLIGGLCILCSPIFAQRSAPRVVVRAGHLLDTKSGKTLVNQAIVIEGEKIVSVGPMAEVKTAAGDQIIELPQATALPGLIDAHTHLDEGPENHGYPGLALSVPRHALIGARNARATLEAGFTTIRNVGADGFSDVALRDAINAGDIPGPR